MWSSPQIIEKWGEVFEDLNGNSDLMGELLRGLCLTAYFADESGYPRRHWAGGSIA